MTTNQNTQTDLESRVKEMEEENELLLLQLHQVQEELEHYYLRNQELEKAQSSNPASAVTHTQGWVDDELPEVLAENRRLRALAEVQQKLHRIETENALNARLGNILIEAADNGALLSVPGKLIKVWRQASRQEPPAVLGGKNFDKVISAYNEGGFDAVERLMTDSAVWPVMQANAYTSLARQLMKTDRRNAAEAARRAHAIDPKPYRLKWLAFRLHEAGEVIEAEAMLDLLPAETPFSDSEMRQADQLRYEAKHARQREAKQQTAYVERRAAVEKQLRALAQERDEQAKLAAAQHEQIERLNQAKAQLTRENA